MALWYRLCILSAPECLARQAYYDLQLQLSTGTLQRDYMVLCHGWVSKQRHEIRAKVHWWKVLGLSNDLWPKWVEEWGLPSSVNKHRFLGVSVNGPRNEHGELVGWHVSVILFGFYPIYINILKPCKEANPIITSVPSMVLI